MKARLILILQHSLLSTIIFGSILMAGCATLRETHTSESSIRESQSAIFLDTIRYADSVVYREYWRHDTLVMHEREIITRQNNTTLHHVDTVVIDNRDFETKVIEKRDHKVEIILVIVILLALIWGCRK